ncbi:amino acid permease [Candidatus Bathyarchaeota archaeon]|nr:amino acid permease [Candidatus Bathyarchaeota archaeon]
MTLASYPAALFHLALAAGLYIVRYRHRRVGHTRTEFKAWDVVLVFFILVQIFVVVMPWWPPKEGPYSGDVSFWYATYCVVGIAM